MVDIVKYTELSTADLLVDAVYEGDVGSRLSGEPISELIPKTANLGGFQASGKGKRKKYVALCTGGEDEDWPDRLNMSTGVFTYYGDNRNPGTELHETPLRGNRILSDTFELLHAVPDQRKDICPFFVFLKYPTTVSARSFQFKGVAVPGSTDLPESADLIAFWTTTSKGRYLNYRAIFTILDAPKISRAWIKDLQAGNLPSKHAPSAWFDWVETGKYKPLVS
ncbi:MAG: hypothetical protein OXI80_03290 [Caldilineaceae bacterium]|nr:hypothetical protein [Caldilineaceae bacterium]MDE0336671.1 hypothetical protein [Caldilineaceae bacterium]